MDPAALGTTLIGLEAVRRRQADALPRARHHHRRLATLRAALAGTLRTVADSLEAPPREPAAGS